MRRFFHIIGRCYLLVMILIVSCGTAHGEIFTGHAYGSREDSLLLRQEALANALNQASEAAGLKLSSSSALFDEIALTSTIEISSAGFVESFEIIKEYWKGAREYFVQIEAKVRPVTEEDKNIRRQPRLKLVVECNTEIDLFAEYLNAHLASCGIICDPAGERCVEIHISLNEEGEKDGIYYSKLAGRLVLKLSGGYESVYQIAATGTGLNEESALNSGLIMLSVRAFEEISANLAGELSGLDIIYDLRVKNVRKPEDLLQKLAGESWLRNPVLVSHNVVMVRFQVTTNRFISMLVQRMKMWDCLFVGREGNRLDFIYRPGSLSPKAVEEATGQSENSPRIPFGWIIAGLAGVLVFIYVVSKLR